MRRSSILLPATAVLMAACGDPDCGDDVFDPAIDRCVPADAGTGADASADAGPADAGDMLMDGGPDCTVDGGAATMCGTDCIDLMTSLDHCGTCDNSCATGFDCITGTCRDVILDIEAGDQHVCVLRGSGRIQCWGDNRAGELGDGTLSEARMPVQVVGIDDAVQIAPGGYSFSASRAFTCARRRTGEVWCWGWNGNGQLGDGTTEMRMAPVRVMGLANAVDVSAGLSHVCAVDGFRDVMCWGENTDGLLGVATGEADQKVAAPVAGLSNVASVHAGQNTSCAVLMSGEVMCWGEGSEGQLGDNLAVDQTSPVATTGITDAADVSLTRFGGTTCARRRSGVVECWGSNIVQRLGRDDVSGFLARPREIVGPRDFQTLEGAYLMLCGVRFGGEVWCWGLDARVPGAMAMLLPTHLPELGSPLDIAVGGGSYCVLDSTARALCGGGNLFGQLGDGTTEARPDLRPVLGLD